MLKKTGLSLLFLFLSFFSYSQSIYTIDGLKDSIKKIMEKEHIPGLMLALVHRDSVIFQGGLGLADIENKIPVSENNLFRIGSITKTFTSLSILQLISDGKFSLDSKLKDIAPEISFENEWEPKAPVRVVHLLEHTAGFDDMHFAAFVNSSGKKISAMEEVMAHQNALHSRWRPGTRMSYSNPGYAILGYLIEKYAEMPYEEFVTKTVIQPLGMIHTTFNYVIEPPYATGYSYHGKYFAATPVVINGGAAGAISSCASDMAKYVRLYLNEGKSDSIRIFPASVIHEMEFQHSTVAAAAGLTNGYGLANFNRLVGEKNKEHFRGHSGGIMGFASDFGYSRAWGVAYAISNNGEGSNQKIKNKIVEFLLQGKSSPLPDGKKVDAGDLQSLEGLYRLKSSRNEILTFVENMLASATVSLQNDTLRVQNFLDSKTTLIPVGNNQFRKKNEPVASYVFASADDQDVFVNEGDYMVRTSWAAVWPLRIAIAIALLCGILIIPFAIGWLVMLIMKKLDSKELLIRLVPFLAMMSLTALILTFANLVDLRNIATAANINGRTFTIFVSSLLFPLLSAAALYLSLKKSETTRSRFIRYYLLTTSLSFCFLSVYLLSFGWVGIRIWSY